MVDNPIWSPIYAPRGYLLVEGDWVKREAYGRTLERVAEEGSDAFYTGDIAKSMVDTVQSFGGILSLDDVRVIRLAPLTSACQLQSAKVPRDPPNLPW
jgi:gamma-glutamyltranspeptidase